MEVLVIGGSGFIGTRLVDELLGAGHNVKILDIKISSKYPAHTIVGDVRNVNDIVAASKNIEVIYNLAAEHRDDVTPISLYSDVNVDGAKNIVEASIINNIKTIIFTSTVAIYGLNKNSPDESFPAEPFNEYGRSKWKAEQIFNDWASSEKSRGLVIIRPAVVFGEGNRGNVYNLMSQIQSGKFIMIGSGNNRKSMGYVGNIAFLLSKFVSNTSGVSIFNYCDKPDLTSQEIASFISERLQKPIPQFRLPLGLGIVAGKILDVISRIFNKKFPVSEIRIRKFSAETTISTDNLMSINYQPRYTIYQGLERMLECDFLNKNNSNVTN